MILLFAEALLILALVIALKQRKTALTQAQASLAKAHRSEMELHHLNLGLEQRVDERTERLSLSRSRLADAQRIARLGNWDWNIVRGELWWSDEIYRIFGVEPRAFEATYEAFLKKVHPDDRELVIRRVNEALEDRCPYDIEHRILLSDGSMKQVHEQGIATFDGSGTPIRMRGTVQDITERKQAEEALRLAASVFTHTREGITITDAEGSIIDINDAFTRISGYSREEVLGKKPSLLKSGRHGTEFYAAMWRALNEQGYWSGEIWNRRKNGEVYPELLTISDVRDDQGKLQHFVALFTDISAQKLHQEHLTRIAHYDALTRLPNRVLLIDRLHQAMAQAERHGTRLLVVYLDLDGFKAINDSHGHQIGDQLLISVATRLKQSLREGDTIARLGGDEFVAVLTDLADIETGIPILARLLAAAARPVLFKGLSLQVSASLGASYFPQDAAMDVDQLLRQADQAMYQAKIAGKNRYQIFDTG